MNELHQLKDFSAALANDLATGLQSPEEVFKRHGLSKDEGERLLNNTYFQDMIRQAKKDWESMDNVKKRLQAKAALALEEGLLDLYQILSNRKESAQARVAAAKELKDIAKVESANAGTTGGGVPAIQIFLGSQEEPISVGGQTIDHEPQAQPLPGGDAGGNLQEVFGASSNDDLEHPERSGSGSSRKDEDPKFHLDVDFSSIPE